MTRSLVTFLLSPKEYASICKSGLSKHSHDSDSPSAAKFRSACRSFTAAYALTLAIDVAIPASLGKQGIKELLRKAQKNAIRSGLSFAGVFLSHPILLAFLIRFRQKLVQRRGRPSPCKSLRYFQSLCSTEYFPPIVAGVLSGTALAIHPPGNRRVSIAIYLFTKAVESFYKFMGAEGYLPNLPWWFGSWMMAPFASSQLLHAMFFDGDCFPNSFKSFIFGFSNSYVKKRPADYPAHLAWPDGDTIIKNIAEISRKNYPKFKSPVLRPGASTVPLVFEEISPILNLAHPSITYLSCASLHPDNPSCTKTLLEFCARQLVPVSKFMFVFYTCLGLLRYERVKKDPLSFIMLTAQKIAGVSAFVTFGFGTCWASVCAFQRILPDNFLPRWRFHLAGFIGGLFAFLDREHGKSRVDSLVRLSLASSWKIVEKRHKKINLKHVDVYLFAASLGIIMALFQSSPSAFSDSLTRKSLNVLCGNSWVDPVKVANRNNKAE
ncbi:hypothetical protein NEOLI_000668 [Neolecta irregularis DAH-3]|uniref:Transmembrane protein 135 N-terminal domain-containing protein n=1 Tax=Neolecta irregularis (strain DAH-3) TaxID=1198029 RepID=A0A1U7LW58_NEOID|nr:hypothetical protein NEOLI_000668 [Neolecta irregularis DAH-3]|eukprot:OLL26741.1 hypothetical protein NEOLI_000668 [Neolecta irregularis DAH-3]